MLNLGSPRCCKANVLTLHCGDELTLGKAIKGSNSRSCLKAEFALPAMSLAMAARFDRAPDTDLRERLLGSMISGKSVR